MKKIPVVLVALLAIGVASAATGEIISPQEQEVVFGDVTLMATYDDGDELDDDIVQWAVRDGTCAVATNTVFGNVDGYDDPYSWDGMTFEATIDTSGLEGGMYCFVFNPADDEAPDVRLTQEFYVAETYVNGGGHALAGEGKRKDMLDFSFGGWAADVGDMGVMGAWQVNLHNVNEEGLDKSKFHTTNITSLNYFAPGACAAMNLEAEGELDGEPGYSMIFRAGDSFEPASESTDTVRVEIYGPEGLVYDSHASGEFPDESDCYGTARTGLDTGNINIWG